MKIISLFSAPCMQEIISVFMLHDKEISVTFYMNIFAFHSTHYISSVVLVIGVVVRTLRSPLLFELFLFTLEIR